MTQSNEQLVEAIAAALIGDIERQTEGDWPLELREDLWVVDGELNIKELAQAALLVMQERMGKLEQRLHNCFNIACDYTIRERDARSEIANQARIGLTTPSA